MSRYFILRDVISKEECKLISDYARLKAKVHYRTRKKDLLANVHREYADPLMEVLLERLRPIVEEATGLELWPTLSFYYSYRTGNQLAKHRDRASCEIVAGLCLGADEDFKKKQGVWPLIIEEEGQPHEALLEEGDIVIFKGHETIHWREPYQGKWFVSAIFAYVDKKGPYSFLKYDQRNQLGEKHIGMFRWSFGLLKNYIRSKL